MGWEQPVTKRQARPRTLFTGARLASLLIENEQRWKRERATAREAERAEIEAQNERRSQRLRERRARRRNAPSEPYTRQEVYDRDQGRCYMCLVRLAPGWHIEHVIPLARGGSDTFDNVRASCPRCNLRKHTQEPCYRY